MNSAYGKFLFACVAVSILVSASPADTLSAAYLGFARDKAPEFIVTLENEVFQKILYFPGIRFVSQDTLARAFQREIVPGRLLSPQQAESACAALGCRILIFCRIERADIRPERLTYFPLLGRYAGDLAIRLWTYDFAVKSFRLMDPIGIKARTPLAYAGFGGFSRNIPLTSHERISIQKQWIYQAKEQIFNKLQLNLSPLLTPVPAEEIQPETVPPESTASPVDSAQAVKKTPPAPADSGGTKAPANTGAATPQQPAKSSPDTGTTK